MDHPLYWKKGFPLVTNSADPFFFDGFLLPSAFCLIGWSMVVNLTGNVFMLVAYKQHEVTRKKKEKKKKKHCAGFKMTSLHLVGSAPSVWIHTRQFLIGRYVTGSVLSWFTSNFLSGRSIESHTWREITRELLWIHTSGVPGSRKWITHTCMIKIFMCNDEWP